MSLPSFFQKLLGVGKKASIDLFHAMINFVRSPQTQALIETALGQIVKAVVSQLAGNAYATLSSDQKRQQAFSEISTQAKSAGIDFTDSAVNLLIETVIAGLKLQPQG